MLDQQVIPALIDAAGWIEGRAERFAGEVRRRPGAAMGAVLLGGMLMGILTRPKGPLRRGRFG
jgi:hypothetical protein